MSAFIFQNVLFNYFHKSSCGWTHTHTQNLSFPPLFSLSLNPFPSQVSSIATQWPISKLLLCAISCRFTISLNQCTQLMFYFFIFCPRTIMLSIFIPYSYPGYYDAFTAMKPFSLSLTSSSAKLLRINWLMLCTLNKVYIFKVKRQYFLIHLNDNTSEWKCCHQVNTQYTGVLPSFCADGKSSAF